MTPWEKSISVELSTGERETPTEEELEEAEMKADIAANEQYDEMALDAKREII